MLRLTKTVTKGTRFHALFAEEILLFETVQRAGRSAWHCVVVNEPYVLDGVTYASDFAGERRVFATSEIEARIAQQRYAEERRRVHDAFFATLVVGTTVHYHYFVDQFVRCTVVEVDGKKMLREDALVGAWREYDLRPDSYHVKGVAQGRTFAPNVTTIVESPEYCGRHGLDPRSAPALSLPATCGARS